MIISSNIISLEMSSDAAGCGDRPALGLKSVKTMIDIKSIPPMPQAKKKKEESHE